MLNLGHGVPPETDPADLAVHVTLDDEALAQKMHALRCQASQIDPLVERFGESMMIELNREEFFLNAP